MSNENIINDIYESSKPSTNCDSKSCDSRVLDSATLNECDNKYNTPMGRTGPLIAKIPVVLSEIEVQIDVEAEIRLEEPALDIKTIDKHIFLTQCKLIPHTNKLFIAGHVQKNIQFSTIGCTNKTSISGNIQHTTVNVPFKCVTKIPFSKYPIYGKEYKKKLNTLDDSMMGKDSKEDSWIHYSKLYEPVFCELEYAKILETDIINQRCPIPNTLPYENSFQELTEKMVIFIRLKVLQNQQVCIPEPHGEVTVVETCSSDYNNDDDKTPIDVEVGYDPEKGMIGREVPLYHPYED